MEACKEMELPGLVELQFIELKKVFLPPGFSREEYDAIRNRTRNLTYNKLYYLRSLCQQLPGPIPPELEESCKLEERQLEGM